MKLTRAASYALHAVAHIAETKSDSPTASHIIAERHSIPERFLLKVLKPLVSAGLLISIKGPNGGYRLARPASQINMLEVIEAVEGPIRGVMPFESGNGISSKLNSACEDAANHVRKTYESVRISELV
jgi:Rrf2 family protein